MKIVKQTAETRQRLPFQSAMKWRTVNDWQNSNNDSLIICSSSLIALPKGKARHGSIHEDSWNGAFFIAGCKTICLRSFQDKIKDFILHKKLPVENRQL